jgi:N-acetylmuramate 1-kinase
MAVCGRGDRAARDPDARRRGGRALAPYGVALLDPRGAAVARLVPRAHLGVERSRRRTPRLLERASARLAVAALEQPQVFVHRDYHSRNLMVCADGNPGILDFQDAVRGAITYDLVSLLEGLLHRLAARARARWVEDYRDARRRRGLAVPDDAPSSCAGST